MSLFIIYFNQFDGSNVFSGQAISAGRLVRVG